MKNHKLYMNLLFLVAISISFTFCKKNNKEKTALPNEKESSTIVAKERTIPPSPPPIPKPKKLNYDSTKWTDIIDLDPTIGIDMRYATEDNFVKEQMYECGRCFLRPSVAKALVQAHILLREGGYRLKVFDCYRPRPVQQKLWDKVPNASYVTPPEKGSMHNRGAAVDVTIITDDGYELDMGTPFDFFGKKAHIDYTELPEDVLRNRKLLRKTMETVGFKGIRTEWWHFSLQTQAYEISDYLWECE